MALARVCFDYEKRELAKQKQQLRCSGNPISFQASFIGTRQEEASRLVSAWYH
jgi:hypothetical protein